MSANSLMVDALFEDGIFRPNQSLPLASRQKVKLLIQWVEPEPNPWPADTADIYRELEAEDRRLAEAMVPGIRQTWPKDEETA